MSSFLHRGKCLNIGNCGSFQRCTPRIVSGKYQANFYLAISHRTDVAAFLARHEETMHAMGGLSSGEQNQYTDTDTATVHLSLKSINEDTNLIVKLINSTLYDGLKAGASDIYLECANTGLVIKYRIDGVNDCSTQTNT